MNTIFVYRIPALFLFIKLNIQRVHGMGIFTTKSVESIETASNLYYHEPSRR